VTALDLATPAPAGVWAIWPQGMPEAARFAASPTRATLVQTAMMLALVRPFGNPPRIRVHHDPVGRPDPDALD
jgi:hypothetical protein